MARLRKFSAYRRIERPYTRISKFRKKSYVRSRPNIKVVRFDMGDLVRRFDYSLVLHAKEGVQIRDNALEAARMTSNRLIIKKVGKTGFHLKIRIYPHHILRENPLAAGAGADRMSTGMKRSFGKTIGIAAQVKKNQPIMQMDVNKEHISAAKLALERAAKKFPCKCFIEILKNEDHKVPAVV